MNYIKYQKWLVAFSLFVQSAKSQIITYPINQLLVGVGQLTFDIDNDNSKDFTFDIISLSSPTVLAARVYAEGASKILDNSTFGYPDALNFNDPVTGSFHSGNGVLGTFNNAGQFRGVGNKYLGVIINSGPNNYYGWILLNCNFNRDSLKIISCAYNSQSNSAILAGQQLINGLFDTKVSADKMVFYPNPVQDFLNWPNEINSEWSYTLYSTLGEEIAQGSCTEGLKTEGLTPGLYSLSLKRANQTIFKKVLIKP